MACDLRSIRDLINVLLCGQPQCEPRSSSHGIPCTHGIPKIGWAIAAAPWSRRTPGGISWNSCQPSERQFVVVASRLHALFLLEPQLLPSPPLDPGPTRCQPLMDDHARHRLWGRKYYSTRLRQYTYQGRPPRATLDQDRVVSAVLPCGIQSSCTVYRVASRHGVSKSTHRARRRGTRQRNPRSREDDENGGGAPQKCVRTNNPSRSIYCGCCTFSMELSPACDRSLQVVCVFSARPGTSCKSRSSLTSTTRHV